MESLRDDRGSDSRLALPLALQFGSPPEGGFLDSAPRLCLPSRGEGTG